MCKWNPSRKKGSTEKIFEELVKNFLNVMKPINSLIQEAHWSHSRVNVKKTINQKTTPRHSITTLLKANDKENNKGKVADLLSWRCKQDSDNLSTEKKNSQPRILYSAKISCKMKAESILSRLKPSQFTASNPACKKCERKLLRINENDPGWKSGSAQGNEKYWG